MFADRISSSSTTSNTCKKSIVASGAIVNAICAALFAFSEKSTGTSTRTIMKCSFFFISSKGVLIVRANLSAVLPRKREVKKWPPCSPITVKSADNSSALATISFSGSPNLTVLVP